MATNTERILPVGIQDFQKIRENGYIYVDKTPQIYRLISGVKGAFFLSRPRRFGKSLLCSTLGAIFEGRRELFGEIAGRPALALSSLDWEWKAHPVIYIDLNAGNYKNGVKTLYSTIYAEMRREAKKYGVKIDRTDTPAGQFKNLIEDAFEKTGEKAVVIIDEYDKPLTNTLSKRDVHVLLRDELKEFYGVLKSYDKYLRFIFITGVSKFSHVSLFSDLNQLSDLTLDPRYADICGLAEEEITANFAPEIDCILKTSGCSREEYIERLRRFYNGYRFSDAPLAVYNPFGMLNHLEHNGKFEEYWYESATPSFLVELIENKKINVLDMNRLQVGCTDFGKYDIDHMTPAPILCQTGYLTISGYNPETGVYTLDFPNDEVRASFAGTLVRHYVGAADDDRLDLKLLSAIAEGNLDAAMDTLSRFFATIPYEIVVEKEMYFQTVVHLLFTMLNFNCRSEVRIATGRIDTLVVTRNFVYCFEFKLDGSAEAALAQIDTKEYAVPWTGSGKKVFKVGVNFDFEKRNIGEWVSAAVGAGDGFG
jgi:hypothetical protein